MSNKTKSGMTQLLTIGASVFAITACQPSGSAGFSLPEGDADAGQVTFVDMGCNSCHTVAGVEGLRNNLEEPERTIALGGEKTRTYTYGELVTSIINPSHKISQRHLGDMVESDGQSLMRNYNDILTVTEMINLVTFLEQHYSLKPYQQTYYSPYGPLQAWLTQKATH